VLRKSQLPENDGDGYARLVQFTVGCNAVVLNLTDKLPKLADDFKNFNALNSPHFYASTGFVYLIKEQEHKMQTMESN
jgi:hypothetical protein